MNEVKIENDVRWIFCLKNKPIRKLKKILKLKEKVSLESYYYVYSNEDENEMSKNELIDYIFGHLTNDNVIYDFISTLTEDEFNMLVKIYNNDCCLIDNKYVYHNINWLMNYGIIYLFGYEKNIYLVIPDEIKEILDTIDLDEYKENVKENTNIVNLAYSMLNLYGPVSIDTFSSYYEKYYGRQFDSLNDFTSFFGVRRTNPIDIVRYNDLFYLIKTEFLDELFEKSKYTYLMNRDVDDFFIVNYKPIEIEELLKYCDSFYYKENEYMLKFVNYLVSKGMKEEDAKDCVGSIINSFVCDYNDGMELLAEDFAEFKFELNDDNIDEILTYVNEVIDNIPLWGNKGWTNKEIILRKNNIMNDLK